MRQLKLKRQARNCKKKLEGMGMETKKTFDDEVPSKLTSNE